MNQEQFEKVVNERFEAEKNILLSKGKIYAMNGDRLGQFKKAALIGDGQTPEQALLGMWKKHLVKLVDMIEATQDGIFPEVSQRQETIGDARNYLILLDALWIERELLQDPVPGTYEDLRGKLDQDGCGKSATK
jgi:hypothetical protein